MVSYENDVGQDEIQFLELPVVVERGLSHGGNAKARLCVTVVDAGRVHS